MNNLGILYAIVGSIALVGRVTAHGFVKNIVINGTSYQGYDPTVFPYQQNPPIVVGWTTSQTDLGYVDPSNFGSSDIICHRSAKPAGGHARVAAGDSIAITWNTWPESHHGPMIDYLAACNGPCETANKADLRFFKIDGAGKADPSAESSPGYWADDVMMANGLTWLVRIPPFIKPGNYVLRHEIIALHGASQVNGAQAYPQCFNLEITGSGTVAPAGVLGTQLYNSNDPGILYNLYTTPQPFYTVPGPTLIAGASSSVPQSSSTITKSTTATVGYSSTGSAVTGSDVSSTRTSTSTSTSQISPSVSPSSPTTSPGTTKTSTSQSSTAAIASSSLVPLYGQCGGFNYQGSTECAQFKVACNKQNDYYSQCLMVPA